MPKADKKLVDAEQLIKTNKRAALVKFIDAFLKRERLEFYMVRGGEVRITFAGDTGVLAGGLADEIMKFYKREEADEKQTTFRV